MSTGIIFYCIKHNTGYTVVYCLCLQGGYQKGLNVTSRSKKVNYKTSCALFCFVETSALGCADTERNRRVNCVQGTTWLLPLTFTHPETHIPTCRGALAKGPTCQRKEKKGENKTGTSTVSHHTTDKDERQEGDWLIIFLSLAGLKANQDPRRGHLH